MTSLKLFVTTSSLNVHQPHALYNLSVHSNRLGVNTLNTLNTRILTISRSAYVALLCLHGLCLEFI